MATYTYTGINPQGKKIKGEVEADDKETAQKAAEGKGLNNVKVAKNLEISFGQKITLRDTVLFTRTFVTMLEAGLPIIQALDILIAQQTNPKMKTALRELKESVEGGSTLAEGIRGHPEAFDDLYCNLVEAGETGGVLDTVLGRLAVYYEKQEAIVKKVKGAMTYPLITIAVAIGAVAIMLLKVIPTFEKMFADMGAELPGPTQFVVGLSHSLQATWYLYLGTLFSVVTIWKVAGKNEKIAFYQDLFKLKMPLLGNLILLGAMARFTQTLGTLLSSGVPIIESLEIGERVVGNRVLAKDIGACKVAIEAGRTFTEPLGESEYIPILAVQMIEVGETTGQLDSMLEKVSKYFEEEVDGAVDALTAAIEPLIMVFIAGAVGGLLVAMYMPIFSIAGAVS